MDLSPEVKDLYQQLVTEIKKIGSVVVEEKKTSIHIKNKAGFAGIHPRKSYFILTIVSEAPIVSVRIVKQEQVSKNRFHNEVRVEKPDDIDEELLQWLKSAYQLMT